MLQSTELVSVVIPVHNRFDLAKRAIDSVVAQTYRPLEVIIVDDFSAEVFYYEPTLSGDDISLKFTRATSNLGPGTARETGRKACTGNFIAYLDSDDVLKPDFIKKMVHYLDLNRDVDFAYCHAKFMTPEGVPTDESVKKTHLKYRYILPYLITHGRPWHTSACLRRKSLSDKIGPWMPLWFWEDYEYDSRAGIINNRIGYVDEVLSYIDKDGEIKISKNPNTPKKARSYGLAIHQISRNIFHSDVYKEDVRFRIIYHLMKSAARNYDNHFYSIADNNVKELLSWAKIHKTTYIIIVILHMFKIEKFSNYKSRVLRKISSRYRVWY